MKNDTKGYNKMKWQSIYKVFLNNRWAILTLWALIVLVVNILSFFEIDRDLGISFAQNIAAEALGTVAGVLFIQRYVDIANQKEADQTKEMITNNYNSLKNIIIEDHSNGNQSRVRRRRYSIVDYSPRKITRLNQRRRLISTGFHKSNERARQVGLVNGNDVKIGPV